MLCCPLPSHGLSDLPRCWFLLCWSRLKLCSSISQVQAVWGHQKVEKVELEHIVSIWFEKFVWNVPIMFCKQDCDIKFWQNWAENEVQISAQFSSDSFPFVMFPPELDGSCDRPFRENGRLCNYQKYSNRAIGILAGSALDSLDLVFLSPPLLCPSRLSGLCLGKVETSRWISPLISWYLSLSYTNLKAFFLASFLEVPDALMSGPTSITSQIDIKLYFLPSILNLTTGFTSPALITGNSRNLAQNTKISRPGLVYPWEKVNTLWPISTLHLLNFS